MDKISDLKKIIIQTLDTNNIPYVHPPDKSDIDPTNPVYKTTVTEDDKILGSGLYLNFLKFLNSNFSSLFSTKSVY